MADAAWTKVFHDDLLHGCRAANMTGEEIGVYCTVLWLIASRGAPIEFDARWIAGFAGVSTRKATAIIEKLAAMPNKLVIRNGMIANRKMLRTIAERDKKSDQARAAALARWHGDEAELPLENYPPDYRPDKPGDKLKINSRIKSQKSRKSAISGDADASRSVRARDSETQSLYSTHPDSSESLDSVGSGSGSNIDQGADAQIDSSLALVLDAAGFRPIGDDAIRLARNFVARWLDAGIDIERLALPVIRSKIASSPDPTRTLGRFDRAIRHEHAKRRATEESGRSYRPPASPILEPEHEDATFRPLRAALLERLGPVAYARYCNDIAFEDLGVEGGRTIMRIRDPKPAALRFMDGERPALLRSLARRIGFDDVW